MSLGGSSATQLRGSLGCGGCGEHDEWCDASVVDMQCTSKVAGVKV